VVGYKLDPRQVCVFYSYSSARMYLSSFKALCFSCISVMFGYLFKITLVVTLLGYNVKMFLSRGVKRANRARA
jgi:hypothetical protein